MISEGSKDRQPSRLLSVPHVLVHCVGLAVASTLVLASLKLDLYKDLSWWMVLLPPAIALCLTFLVFTVAVFTWVYVAYIFFTQGIEVDVESDFRLDVLFRAAKICFLGHGYVSLLMFSFGLLLWKLHTWPALPLAYPLSPLIVLGMVYMIFAIVFTQPEVDPPSYFLVGISLVSQSIMLVIKLDYAYDLPWAATFAPSWLTYVLLLIYCVLSPLQALREAKVRGRVALQAAATIRLMVELRVAALAAAQSRFTRSFAKSLASSVGFSALGCPRCCLHFDWMCCTRSHGLV